MPDEAIPDIYVDQFLVTTTIFGVNMTFSLSEPHPSQAAPPQHEEKVRLRMSLEHAKIMAMMLRRQLKQYERQNNITIALPSNAYTGMGVPEEDWGQQDIGMPANLPSICTAFGDKEYNLTTHGFREMIADEVTVEVLEHALAFDQAEIIEEYPDTGRGPSCLDRIERPVALLYRIWRYEASRCDNIQAKGAAIGMDRGLSSEEVIEQWKDMLAEVSGDAAQSS